MCLGPKEVVFEKSKEST
jgi:hypothetical protein